MQFQKCGLLDCLGERGMKQTYAYHVKTGFHLHSAEKKGVQNFGWKTSREEVT
jgi:hypothetical protein